MIVVGVIDLNIDGWFFVMFILWVYLMGMNLMELVECVWNILGGDVGDFYIYLVEKNLWLWIGFWRENFDVCGY